MPNYYPTQLVLIVLDDFIMLTLATETVTDPGDGLAYHRIHLQKTSVWLVALIGAWDTVRLINYWLYQSKKNTVFL